MTITASPDPVQPGGTGGTSKTTITASLDPPTPDRYVEMDAEGQLYSGGHQHDGARPKGTFTENSGTTENGQFQTDYYASESGGVEVIKATIQGETFTYNLDVKILGSLSALGSGPYYVLTGQKAIHPSNHLGKSNTLFALQVIAIDYAIIWPADPDLGYNDISLERGGLFDINEDWSPPHSTHRIGINCDLRIWNIPVDHRDELETVINNQGGQNLTKETIGI